MNRLDTVALEAGERASGDREIGAHGADAYDASTPQPAALEVGVLGIGLLGPGLASWATAQAALAGHAGYASTAAALPPPARLPPAERRRAGASIRLAMAVADEAVAQAGLDPQRLATVFTASGGEGVNCHALCETLASADRHLSPTRFTNSVHNAAAGYWHIAVGSQAASTSLSAFDGSFCAGLIEAATQVACSAAPVLLVACDVPYPDPLHRLRALPHHMGVALVLAPASFDGAIARLAIELLPAAGSALSTHCDNAELEALRRSVPCAAALPLLQALAGGAAQATRVLDYLPTLKLRIHSSRLGGGVSGNTAP
jgi:hypothetical protein